MMAQFCLWMKLSVLLEFFFLYFQEAVRTLNTLQSNAAVLEKARAERQRNRHLNLPNTISFAERVGIQVIKT